MFLPVFIFIFVFAVFYGLLNVVPFFGKNQGINLLIAFVIALLLVIVPGTMEVVKLAVPWFAIFVVMTMLIIMVFMFLGVKSDDLSKLATHNATVITIVIATIILIFFTAITQVYGPVFTSVEGCAGFWCSAKKAILHPRALGAIFILIIASYAIRAIAPIKAD